MVCKQALPLLLLLITALACCADMPPSAGGAAADLNDPFETMNRRIFDNNDFTDRLLVRPLAELYRVMIPPGIRDRLAGVLGNMKEPVIFANDLLQGDLGKAEVTLERFGINTTLGIGGMWDFAGDWGLYRQTGDFGQTLAVWGMGEGPYLVLPLFGPSNVRDAIGRGVDIALSPWQYLTLLDGTGALIDYEAAYFGSDTLVRREKNIERFDAFRKGSVDYYAQMRSAYRQYRAHQLGLAPADNFTALEGGQ